MNPVLEKLSPLIRAWDGPLTQELVQHPGDFGLGKIPARLTPNEVTTMVCGFCSTGCGLKIHLKDGQAINLSADTDYPVNLGMACPKGWEALTPLSAPDRATTPLLRNEAGVLEPIDWERAMVRFCARFKEIKAQHGPESCAFLGTGQIVTEEMALLGALWKFGMGFVHCDSNTRQCMATAHVAYKESFGFDAPPFTYADFEESDVLVFIGSNLCIAHPIMWQRVMRNRHRPEIIVIDPRKTETAMAATQHYALAPKSDLVLLYGLANILIASGWVDREFIAAHTTGFDAFVPFVSRFTTDYVAAETGLTAQQLWHLAQTIADGRRVSFWWTMGVNQSHEATRTAQAIINLALMTGNIGRPGTGANSVTGQCNAMGSRLYANITSLLGGHDFQNDAHRAKIAGILAIDSASIPRQASMAYDQIVSGIAAGKIKGLWVIATNGAHSWVNQSEFSDILGKLDFLVVQDMYHSTETAQRADLVLPAAGWGEKEGTFINSERRFGLVKKVSRAPGQALSDFHICKLIAHYWGCGPMFQAWSSPEATFQLMKEFSRGQPCDISGIADYRMLDECGGVQWPLKEGMGDEAGGMRDEAGGMRDEVGGMGDEAGGMRDEVGGMRDEVGVMRDEVGGMKPTDLRDSDPSYLIPPTSSLQERRLFADGHFFHADGRARIIFEEPRETPEPVDDEYPFIMLTGRGTSSQWHTNTRTGKSDVLRKLYPAKAYVEINPGDAARLGIAADARVQIASRRGAMEATAFVTETVRAGQIFLPMHYAAVNQLTHPVFDPYSRQPSYKATAVAVRAL